MRKSHEASHCLYAFQIQHFLGPLAFKSIDELHTRLQCPVLTKGKFANISNVQIVSSHTNQARQESSSS